MSISFSGTFKRSGGVLSAVAKQLRTVNLKALNKVSVRFDPFGEGVAPTRDLLNYLTGSRIAGTNPNCSVKAEVVCDRSEPLITFNLVNGQKIIFKSQNLTTLEILQQFNKHITPLAPVEEPVVELTTKSTKKVAGKKR